MRNPRVEIRIFQAVLEPRLYTGRCKARPKSIALSRWRDME